MNRQPVGKTAVPSVLEQLVPKAIPTKGLIIQTKNSGQIRIVPSPDKTAMGILWTPPKHFPWLSRLLPLLSQKQFGQFPKAQCIGKIKLCGTGPNDGWNILYTNVKHLNIFHEIHGTLTTKLGASVYLLKVDEIPIVLNLQA